MIFNHLITIFSLSFSSDNPFISYAPKKILNFSI